MRKKSLELARIGIKHTASLDSYTGSHKDIQIIAQEIDRHSKQLRC